MGGRGPDIPAPHDKPVDLQQSAERHGRQPTIRCAPVEQPPQRACSIVRRFALSAAEIAHICDLSPAAAKQRLFRAKQRLCAAYLAQNPRSPTRLARQEEPSAHALE